MNCTDCTARVHAYVDGELTSTDARAVEAHLSDCATCRADVESLQRLRALTQTLPRSIAPRRDLWAAVSRQLLAREAAVVEPFPGSPPARPANAWRASDAPRGWRWLAPLGMAAGMVFFASLAERQLTPPSNVPAWSVSAVSGAPRVGERPVHDEARFRLGQWLETDAASRAKVAVGAIGEVTVAPNSRLRLLGTGATDHRLELARGTLDAFIWAPPRLFYVDTPSATAVDLGCAYTLTVDDAGNGELRVSTGYVALEHGDRESIIAAGMTCLTRRGKGPGTPFADDAPEALRRALARFDFEPAAASAALDTVLAHVRAEDAITLWHLLGRVPSARRGAVFDRLVEHAPAPAGVTREGIIRGDPAMRRAWAAALGLHP